MIYRDYKGLSARWQYECGLVSLTKPRVGCYKLHLTTRKDHYRSIPFTRIAITRSKHHLEDPRATPIMVTGARRPRRRSRGLRKAHTKSRMGCTNCKVRSQGKSIFDPRRHPSSADESTAVRRREAFLCDVPVLPCPLPLRPEGRRGRSGPCCQLRDGPDRLASHRLDGGPTTFFAGLGLAGQVPESNGTDPRSALEPYGLRESYAFQIGRAHV